MGTASMEIPYLIMFPFVEQGWYTRGLGEEQKLT
jgi:hypothetical protein